MLPKIDAPVGIIQRITANVEKLCPVKNELDEGTVTVTYVSNGSVFELHALAEYLAGFASVPISHEDFTRLVARTLNAEVTSTWTTAGMKVTCGDDRVLR